MIAIFSLNLFQRLDFTFSHMCFGGYGSGQLDMVVDMEVGKVAIIVVDMEVGNVADEVADIVVKIPNEDFTDSGDGDTFEDNVRGSDQRDGG